MWPFKTRRRQAARTRVPPESLERSPTEQQGEKAEGTEESRALHLSENTATVNARSASAVLLHRVLRVHFIILYTIPFPTPHPSRSGSGRGRQASVSAAPQRPTGVSKATLGSVAACCRGFCLLTASLYYRKPPR